MFDDNMASIFHHQEYKGIYLLLCYGFRPHGLDACLSMGLGGAALALGARRVSFVPLLPFFRFVVLVT